MGHPAAVSVQSSPRSGRRTSGRILLDVLVPVLVLAVALIGAPPSVSELGEPELVLRPDVVVPALLGSIVLTVRRRAPLLVWVLTVVTALGALALSQDPGRSFVAVVVALFFLAAHTDRRTAMIGAVVTLAIGSAAALRGLDGGLANPVAIALLPWCGLAAVLGDAVRVNRGLLLAARERADIAERTREEEAGRRVAEERLRLSRELHDVIGHHLAVINAQAGAAEQLLGANPRASRAALGEIRSAAAEALRQTGRLVGVLRSPGDDSLDPMPRLVDLPRLVEDLRRRGVDLQWIARGALDVDDPTVQQHGHRIVQEALTNAVRHGSGTVRLRTERSEHQLAIEVRNAFGRAAVEPGTAGSVGHGLTGMRERVALCRGTLETRRDGNDHVVLVRLPLTEERDG